MQNAKCTPVTFPPGRGPDFPGVQAEDDDELDDRRREADDPPGKRRPQAGVGHARVDREGELQTVPIRGSDMAS